MNGTPGAERELVREGQDILRAHGIDPLTGIENLTWAPNKGHTIKETRAIVGRLRSVHTAGGGRNDIKAILDDYAEKAKNR